MYIRTLSKSTDLDQFIAIRIEGARNCPIVFRDSSEEMESKSTKDFEDHLDGLNSRDFFVGAFMDTELVGVAALYHQKNVKLSHKSELGSVYVKPEHRNKGIAKKLIQDIIVRAKNAGEVRHIGLSVCTTNASALRVYEHLGFTRYGTEPGAVMVDGNLYDEYLMQLVL